MSPNAMRVSLDREQVEAIKTDARNAALEEVAKIIDKRADNLAANLNTGKQICLSDIGIALIEARIDECALFATHIRSLKKG